MATEPSQPPGFYVLTALVLLERFAGYALGSTLVLYLCGRAGYSPGDAVRAAGLVSALGYVGTVPGGLLADQVFGHRRTLALGTALLALGYALLSIEHTGTLCPALLALSFGGALFRPNTSALLAGAYGPGDTRLDAAQTGIYIAANVGAAGGALVAGLLASRGAWSATFLLASGAMLTAGLVLVVARRHLLKRRVHASSGPSMSTPDRRLASLGTIACVALAGVLYAVGFGQVEGGLLLWAQDRADRTFAGFEFPAGWVVGLPAVLVLLIGPAQLRLLQHFRARVPTAQLIAAGLISTALAFGVLIPGAWGAGTMRVGLGWIVGSVTLLVIGELLVGPLSMSLLTRLAPPHWVALVMGLWYAAVALGAWLGGEIGALWLRWPTDRALALLVTLPLLGALLIFLQDKRSRRGTSGHTAAEG